MNDMDKPAKLELDELDLMLTKELELDARQSIRVLSRKLGVTEITVRKRMLALLDRKVITIAVFTNPYSFGFNTVLTLGFHVVPGRTDEVAECLRRIKSIKTITLTAGRYDMLSYAVLRSHQELPSFLYQELGQIPYLVRTETMLVLDAVKASWKYLSQDIQRFRKTTHSDIDELDIELIKELELCPRESIRTLGKKLGVNRNLVGKRLNSLLDNGIIRVVSPISEPSILGFNLDVTILVRAQLGKVMGVANSLIHETRVRHVATTNGPFELYLRAAFRDAEEMSDFLTKRLGSHEGVTSYETLIHLKTIQESYSLL